MAMKNDQEFTKAIQDQLRQRETDLPTSVSKRLAEARRAAVAEAEIREHKKPGLLRPAWMLPAGGFAVAALTLALYLPSGNGALPVLEESEMLAATEMEMLDDIELLAWIIEQDNNAEL